MIFSDFLVIYAALSFRAPPAVAAAGAVVLESGVCAMR